MTIRNAMQALALVTIAAMVLPVAAGAAGEERCYGIARAGDGGFWLVGARHGSAVPAGVFANVRWSGEHALSDSLASAATARIALVQSLHDVDCAADLGLPAGP